MILFLIAGLVSYVNLGREEDPNFAIKTMLIQASWPGAPAEEMSRQVTERIERKVEELDNLKITRSMTTEGETVVYVELLDSVRGEAITRTWTRVRQMIGDIQLSFPQGVVGPLFNDRFGDVFGNIYAFTADGFNQRQLRDVVESVRSEVLLVPDVGQVNVLGAQTERVYLEFSTAKVEALGLDQQQVLSNLQAQTAVVATGVVQAGDEQVAVRIGGQSATAETLRDLSFRVGDRFLKLTDIATIKTGYEDPPKSLFRYNGESAMGIAIGMQQGANLLDFGAALEQRIARVMEELPVGIDIHKVSDQPAVVKKAIGHFTRALLEAVVIVLAISFISLGVRAGLVVTVSIPLVLAITFAVMAYMDITLQRISLGALIIALGLLVDDAMIAVEMMIARLEAGDNLQRAATYVYTSTAFPMLTGTLVTVAGFIPIGLNSSAAGEFTFTLFVVIAVSLLVSWIVAVLFTPLLGVTLLPKSLKHKQGTSSWFARGFSRTLAACLRFRYLTIGITLTLLAVSIYAFQFVEQQFFPDSDRPELVVQFKLDDASSIAATNARIAKFEADMLENNDAVQHWSSYIGNGAPRFLLTFESPLPSASTGQIVVVTHGGEERDRLRRDFQDYIVKQFPDSDITVDLLALGPPTGKPVQYRINGQDVEMLRQLARDLAGRLAKNTLIRDISYDWMEPARVVRATLLGNQAQKLGVTPVDVATALNNVSSGNTITQIRDDIYLINLVARAEGDERQSLESLRRANITLSDGRSIPMESVVTFSYELEQPVIWRRSRVPTITVKANVAGAVQPATVVGELAESVKQFSDNLPLGYQVTVGGAVEDSANSQGPITAAMPLMLLIMATILMLQLQSFARLFLVFAVAPFAIIGVVIALLPTGTPMGFVAILGILALIGILIRNSVILIVQIEDHRRGGITPWQAVVEATEHRMRPILLTAAAASLALIPISRDVFWGPMAYAMMGGIIVGTILTLLFLPALYLAVFRISPETPQDQSKGALEQPALEPDKVDTDSKQ